MYIKFERYDDWSEKWFECPVDDLICLDHVFYINGESMELSEFLKVLLEQLKDKVEVFKPVEE